jgi:predicted DNA-binding transcriptional regulator AlpA
MEAIVEMLPRALAAGITKREFSDLTGVSRPWIDALLRRQSGR